MFGLLAGIGGGIAALVKRRKNRGDKRLPMYDQDPTQTPTYGSETGGEFGRLGDQAAGYGSQYSSALGQQNAATGMLQQAAMGQGPSVAQEQMQQATDQSIATQQALAAGGRGGNLAQVGRQASQVGAAQQMDANAQIAQLRAAEMQAAQQAYAQQTNQLASQAQAGQMGYEQMLGQANAAQLGTGAQWGLGQRELDLQQRQGNRGFGLGIANTVGSVVGKVGSMAGVGGG